MMSIAAWGPDTTRVARALASARDSVDSLDARLARHARIAALDSAQRAVKHRTAVSVAIDSFAAGYALDRAARALGGGVDSALLDIGGQFLWVGPAGRRTSRPVGIPDPDNSLRMIGYVMLQGGSLRIASRERGKKQARTSSVTVLAPDALSAAAWAHAFLSWDCDSALANGRTGGMSVVCADSTGVRWTSDLQNRVSLPPPPLPPPGRARGP